MWATHGNGSLLPGAGLTWITRQVVPTFMYCPNAQQDTHHDSNESVDVNWRSTLPQRQSQRLAPAQRHDAIREAAKQAVLATVQADRDSVVQT